MQRVWAWGPRCERVHTYMCVQTSVYSTLINHWKQCSRIVHLLFQKWLNHDIVDSPARQRLMEFWALETPGVDGSSLRQHLWILKGLCVCVWRGRECAHRSRREGKGGFYGSLLLGTKAGVKRHNWEQPNIIPEGRNAFVISANINCAEAELQASLLSWVCGSCPIGKPSFAFCLQCECRILFFSRKGWKFQ